MLLKEAIFLIASKRCKRKHYKNADYPITNYYKLLVLTEAP